MKERLTIRKRGQVTLPKSFIEKFNLEEGDSLELEVTNDGEVKVTPMVQVPASQQWFWTKEWQEAEREATEDIKMDRVGPTLSSKEDIAKFFAELDEDSE